MSAGGNPWLVAFVIAIATFMEVLDTTIANVALPYIAGGLGVSLDGLTVQVADLDLGDTAGSLRVAVRHEAVRAELPAALGREQVRITPPVEQGLEGVVPSDVEGDPLAHHVLVGVRRMNAGTGDPACRNRGGRRMSAAAAQELGQNMGVRPLRAGAARARDRGINLDAADPGEEHPVGA